MTGAGLKIAPITKEGKKLGIYTGLTNRNFTGTNFRDLKAQPGLQISAEGQKSSWQIEGVSEKDEGLVLYGPWVSGKLAGTEDMDSEKILTLVQAFKVLLADQFPFTKLSLNEILRTDKGDLLFFPPQLMDFLSTRQTMEQTLNNREVYNYPGLSGEQAISFFLGVISYKTLTGKLPFNGESAADIHDKMRDLNFLPVEKRVPGLKKELADVVNRALSPSEGKMPALTDWEEMINFWIKQGAADELSSEEKEFHKQNLEKWEQKISRGYKRRHYLETNRTSIIRNTVIAAILLLIVTGVLGALLKPPKTKGMGPEEVVRAYYQGISNVDPLMLSDCLDKEALQIDAEAVKMIYLLSKQKQKQYGNPGIYPAERWEKEGYPEIPPFTIVFGITQLEILENNGLEFTVSYNRWYTAHDVENPQFDANTETVTHTGLKITDRLVLEPQRNLYKIIFIERQQEVFYEKEVVWEVMY